MVALPVRRLPEGDDWLYEPKWDGYRALLIKDGKDVQICSRNDKNLTAMYPRVAAAGARQTTRQMVLDGEIVAIAADGRPSFQALQHRRSHDEHQITYYVFDLLFAGGKDLMDESLEARRALLPKVIKTDDVLRLSLELPGHASDVVKALREVGLEGVIAKRRDSKYEPGERSGDWVKFKLERQRCAQAEHRIPRFDA